MTKRAVVQLRCSEVEKARWEGEAVRVGVSLSELARFSMNAFWGDIEQVKAGLRWDASRPGSGFQVPEGSLVEAGGHRAQGDPATGLVAPGGDVGTVTEQSSASTSEPRPSAVQVGRRPFTPDFK